ncbi:MAG: hypothetical protein JSV38_05090 [Desulfobacterales bacterium]|nr:MAG: hypothetical protein JSV38_05090 [Desulfobacterales bacterium]
MTHRLLSLIIPSRNDTYMGPSNWRLETTINFLATELEKINRLEHTEVVVVDWGSKIPLHSVLSLTDSARRITRFILVPVAVHDAVRKDSDFPDSIALNVGIRRSFGSFICQTGNDILWPEHFLQPLFAMLEGDKTITTPVEKTQMIFSRKHIPWEIVSEKPTTKYLDDFINRYDLEIPVEPLNPFFLAPGGSVIMHRNMWCECRGYDETLIYWGANDVNLTLRMKLR